VNSRRSGLVKFNAAALALLATVLVVSGGASAKDRKLKGSDNQAQVVAHISFAGLSAVDMAMQKKTNDKYYIYVQHAKDQGISIIDISKPAQPRAVGVIPWPDPALSSRMNVTGDLAIIAESGVLPMHSSTSNERPCSLGFVESSRSSSGAKVLGSSQVAAGRAQFYLCLEWRRIMGGFKASGSPAATI
jgi:hypothetical protein